MQAFFVSPLLNVALKLFTYHCSVLLGHLIDDVLFIYCGNNLPAVTKQGNE